MAVIEVNPENFDDVLRENESVVVEFWADWCAPCKKLKPIMDKLANEFSEIVFVRFNVAEDSEIPNRYGVSAVPTLIFFGNGKPVDVIIGAIPENEMRRKVREFLEIW
ncbi:MULTISPECIES: thioredoxin [unclassified Archaeoglobus]|jgi:thioredoxin 1|uniref:thioredoxin n=1 Tax=unclassified Archaeoglobus TaxID=2643606 RepID=UPI0025C3CFD4|nr:MULTISPECIES: thioredoxin [unclassified Archaeoglobus]